MSCARALRILHVDDDAVNRLVLDQMLRLFGHEPVAVESGQQALEALRSGGFDLVMTDLHMPEISGQALLGAIRADDASLPVIAVSADLTSHPAEAYEQMGFAGFLAKPLTLGRLEAALDRVQFGSEGAMLAGARARTRDYLKAARGG